MKNLSYTVIAVLILTTSCRKDEFVYSYPETDKLLVYISGTINDREFITEFKYDEANRLLELLEFSDGEQVRQELFTYRNGLLTEKVSGNFTETYTYNANGRLIEKNQRYIPDDREDIWDVRTQFIYSSGKLKKAVVYPRKYLGRENISETGETYHINYKHDSKGNTLEGNLQLGQFRFSYDSKINPLAEYGIVANYGYSIEYTLQPEVKQMNNPTYSYSEIPVMSSLPPKYEITYEYDTNDLPLRATLQSLLPYGQELITLEFNYEPKH